MNSLLLSDGYKQSHREQYPEGTTLVYSNWTPRSSKYAVGQKDGVVVFGIQAFIKKHLMNGFNEHFFSKSLEEVEQQFTRRIKHYLGQTPDTGHIRALHQLGYLPLVIKALPEGSICPIGVPALTIYNTLPEFYWLTNFLETLMSAELWIPMTSATISLEYKRILTKWAAKTCDSFDHIPYQAHDFSMRGMAGLDAAKMSGAGHLLSFIGTDTIPAIDFLELYYQADCEKEVIGQSIPATEHSVMSMGMKDSEIDTFKRLITEIYPEGLVSVVSDTWDLWKVLKEYIPALKEEILDREGKLVIRPDSGDPVEIICGGENTPDGEGVIEHLWHTFGGTINDKGYKVLDAHVGAIYGDSITLERAEQICERLEAKGFASSNIVFGIGSYTFQYNTRDTYGFAMKATYGEIHSIGRNLHKDPITDDGTKKSAKGLLQVVKDSQSGQLRLVDQVDWEAEKSGQLRTVYRDGELLIDESLTEIRQRLFQS